MSEKITVSELAALSRHRPGQWVDVRSVSEFRSGHIPGAVNIPMDEIESRLADLDSQERLVLICQGGQRARMTAALLAECRTDVAVLEGGTNAWKKAGLPLVTSSRMRWSLERQVRLGAGLIVTMGILLALLVHIRWIGLSALVGLGLCFAGLTDICPMGIALSRMPWNGATRCGSAGGGYRDAQCCGSLEESGNSDTMKAWISNS
jgi:rhodanese-related sulfurtransferase